MVFKKQFSIRLTKLTAYCLLTGALTNQQLVFSPSGLADPYSQYGNYANGKQDPRTVYKGTGATILKTPVELPDLPRYSARSYFLGGFDYPADSTLPVRRIELKYAVHEPAEQVLDWYRDALASYSWKILPDNQTQNAIVAVKGKNYCAITAAKSRNPWFASTIGISYKLGH